MYTILWQVSQTTKPFSSNSLLATPESPIPHAPQLTCFSSTDIPGTNAGYLPSAVSFWYIAISSGSTLVSNNLREVEVVMKSEALLIGNRNISPEKREVLDELLFRIEAVKMAEDKKYVLMNAPTEKLQEIIEVLPGMKSPTVMPLAQEGWSSVHTVLDQKRFWEIIGKLKALGAEGILVLPIEKMIL